jgi:hypothetical protein
MYTLLHVTGVQTGLPYYGVNSDSVLMAVLHLVTCSGVPRNFFRGGSKNSAEDRGQRERGSGDSSPLVRGFTQFVNERNPYSDLVVTDLYATELGIWPSFFKTSEFRGGVEPPPPPPGTPVVT